MCIQSKKKKRKNTRIGGRKKGDQLFGSSLVSYQMLVHLIHRDGCNSHIRKRKISVISDKKSSHISILKAIFPVRWQIADTHYRRQHLNHSWKTDHRGPIRLTIELESSHSVTDRESKTQLRRAKRCALILSHFAQGEKFINGTCTTQNMQVHMHLQLKWTSPQIVEYGFELLLLLCTQQT